VNNVTALQMQSVQLQLQMHARMQHMVLQQSMLQQGLQQAALPGNGQLGHVALAPTRDMPMLPPPAATLQPSQQPMTGPSLAQEMALLQSQAPPPVLGTLGPIPGPAAIGAPLPVPAPSLQVSRHPVRGLALLVRAAGETSAAESRRPDVAAKKRPAAESAPIDMPMEEAALAREAGRPTQAAAPSAAARPALPGFDHVLGRIGLPGTGSSNVQRAAKQRKIAAALMPTCAVIAILMVEPTSTTPGMGSRQLSVVNVSAPMAEVNVLGLPHSAHEVSIMGGGGFDLARAGIRKRPRYRWHLGCILPRAPAISLWAGHINFGHPHCLPFCVLCA